MNIPQDLLVLPRIGGLIEVRFEAATPHGRSIASWQVKTVMQRIIKDPVSRGEPIVELTGRIVSGLWSSHVDGRIDRQLEIINRTMSHLEFHCPALSQGRADLCTWKEER